MKIIYLAIGGAAGTILRYLLSELMNKLFGGAFPMGTFAVNMIGSFLIGLSFGIFEGAKINEHFRIFLFVGFFGGFTTFSSFAHENVLLFREANHSHAFLYIALSNIGGILLAWLGYLCASVFKLQNRS